MDKKTTPSLHNFHHRTGRHTDKATRTFGRPSEETLAFLRAFARNYRAETRLPESLQGIILG